MVPVTWILDSSIIDRLTSGSKPISQIAQECGFPIVMVDRKGQDFETPLVEGPCVLYGSHQFVKAISKGQYQPGPLGVNDRTKVSQYMSNLPSEWFLNRWSQFMTWQMFMDRFNNVPSSLPWNQMTGRLFIRPDSGFKTFAGTVLDMNRDVDLDIRTLNELSSVMPDTLILASTAVELQGEFRFVIADGKVVAGSEYRWDNVLDIRRDWPQECWDLAQKVAEHEWQVDIAYTCDVALTHNGPKIIELNGFSCAGLYACDLTLVVDAVSKAAYREFIGEDV